MIIATMEWPGFYAFSRAQHDGLYQTIPASVIYYPDNPTVNKAFSTAEVEVATMVLSDAIMLAADGVDLRIIGVMDYSDQGDVLLARPGITTLQQLRGQEVSFEGVQTFSHLFVLDTLQRMQVHETDVRLRDLSAAAVPGELLAGTLAAGHTWGPQARAAVKQGCTILAHAGDDPGAITEVLVTRATTIAARRPQLQQLVNATWEAIDRTFQDEAVSVAAAAQALGKSPAELEPITGSVRVWNRAEAVARLRGTAEPSVPKRIAHIVDIFQRRGQLGQAFDTAHLIDASLLEGH